jgi:CRP/FNR family cyclic AMP-dependent transcriptional regulator
VSRSEKPLSVVLEEMSWLQILPERSQQRVIVEATETWYAEGEVVARKGEPSTSWIGVAEGLLKISAVYRTGKVVMFTGIPAGSWVGEGSVTKRELRRYDIVAMRRSRVIHVPASTFRWLLDTSFEFNHLIISRLNERLAQYIGMVEIDRITDPVARIARAIATLFNPVLYPRMGPLLELSQAELGELVGLSRTTINAALKQLEAEGYVSTEYGGLMVRDVGGLQNYQERNGHAR